MERKVNLTFEQGIVERTSPARFVISWRARRFNYNEFNLLLTAKQLGNLAGLGER